MRFVFFTHFVTRCFFFTLLKRGRVVVVAVHISTARCHYILLTCQNWVSFLSKERLKQSENRLQTFYLFLHFKDSLRTDVTKLF